MRLDRNSKGRGKYALVKLRQVDELLRNPGDPTAQKVEHALQVLADAGVLDYGSSPETEFFVMRLKDRFAGAGLDGYANAASLEDLEYSEEVREMSRRAGWYHPNCKIPD